MKINLTLVIIVVILVGGLYLWIKKSQEQSFEIYYSHLDQDDGLAASAIDAQEKRDKLRVRNLIAAGIALIAWQGIWIPTSDYRAEKAQSVLVNEAYLSSYENGWDDQCAALFSRLGGLGNPAIGKGISITYPQCLSLKLQTSATDSFKERTGEELRESSTYEVKEMARSQANQDVLTKIFSLSPYWCYGIECVTEREFGIFRPN